MPNVYTHDCTALLYMSLVHFHSILFACHAIICCGRCAWRATAEGWNESAVCTPCSARALLRRRHVPRYCTLTLSGTMLRKAVKSAAFRAKFSARTVTFSSSLLLRAPSLSPSPASALKMRICKLSMILFIFTASQNSRLRSTSSRENRLEKAHEDIPTIFARGQLERTYIFK